MPVLGIGSAITAVNAVQPTALGATVAGMRVGVKQGEGIVKGNASGRPGPNVITGQFRAGIRSDVAVSANLVQGQIGSNAPQAARLEYGFFGTDSLGRNYAQPPYPYLQPSIPGVQAAVEGAIASAISGAF